MRKRQVAQGGDKEAVVETKSTAMQASTQGISVTTQLITKSLRERLHHDLDGSGVALLSSPVASLPLAGRPLKAKVSGDREASDSTAPRCTPERPATVCFDDHGDDFGQLCFDFESTASGAINPFCQTQTSDTTQLADKQSDQDAFDDDLMDEDLIDVNTDMMDLSSDVALPSSSPSKTVDSQPTQPPRQAGVSTPKLDERDDSPLKGSVTKFISPVTMTTRMLAATGDEARKPFVRPAFPTATRDRSPIIGLSSNTLLRTCFRVGEAICQSCQAAKSGTNILIELYVRVLSSERDDLQQSFTFCDLFHAKPPYVQATYAAAIWKSVRLFEYDSARLLQQGRICRCIGTMKRNGKDWTMSVLNIWEATWDDVEWVQGIVQS